MIYYIGGDHVSILTVASGQSVYRGYEYSQSKKVLHMEHCGEGIIQAVVSGSGNCTYDVIVDEAHPRKSQCTCPHAAGKHIVCKHIVAVYFAAHPQEAKKYIEDLEAYWEEEEQRQEEQADNLIKYVHSMKKSELQEALLQLLFDGPDWQYDRFIEENL